MRYLWLAALIFISTLPANGFSLLGPFEEWQTPELGYNALGNDVGAPKNLGEEYRWNVPVITYGFDRSFIDFFGNAGIAAVDAAFHVFNSLPPASDIVYTDYPLHPRFHLIAEAQNILHLTSACMGMIIEQLGLASPERYTWTLRERQVREAWTNYSVINRNFDPETYLPTPYVNRLRFSYEVVEYDVPLHADAVDVSNDASPLYTTSVAGIAGLVQRSLHPGILYEGLSADDAAGLRYLLRRDNLNFERLPSGVKNVIDGEPIVDAALRPGVEKIEFRKIGDSWETLPNWKYTFTFRDRYYDASGLREQDLARTIDRPDIVISAADLGAIPDSIYPRPYNRSSPNWTRAGNPDLPGPGTLQGPVTLTFAKLTDNSYFNQFPRYTSEEDVVDLPNWRFPRWGSYFGSAMPVVVFPVARNGSINARLTIERKPSRPGILQWRLGSYPHLQYELQSSADLIEWQTIQTFTPTTTEAAGEVPLASESHLFFRAYAEP